MTEKPLSLSDRYIAPPFSILDTKQGYWRRRKQAWLDLGVEDGVSRTDLKTTGSLSGTDPQFYTDKTKVEAALGRKLTTREFLEDHYDHNKKTPLRHTQTGGIVSQFDPVLAEIAYRWFCPPSGRIIDPFAGGSVRGIVASLLGRQYTGIDLSQDQINTNRTTWRKLNTKQRRQFHRPRWIRSDARDMVKVASGQYDFFFTCPPYFDLEKYSDNADDLSCMDDREFISAYRQIIAAGTAMLRQNRFACIVVGDVRDKRGLFRRFVSETIQAFDGAGLHLYNDAVLATMIGSLPMRVGRAFDVSRKIGKAHQNVLVFVKGDPRKATQAVGKINLPNDPKNILETGNVCRLNGRAVKAKLCQPIKFTPCRPHHFSIAGVA